MLYGSYTIHRNSRTLHQIRKVKSGGRQSFCQQFSASSLLSFLDSNGSLTIWKALYTFFLGFQSLRVSLFESFLISVELVECFQKVSEAKFARLTEGFSPRDLKKAAADMEMKFFLFNRAEKKQINSNGVTKIRNLEKLNIQTLNI